MARENHPRIRQARALARKIGRKRPYDRLLIVCEGAKTEPLYFEDIRQEQRIGPAHVRILPSVSGTEPRQIVDYAELKFLECRAYERVYAVFDRDSHRTYHDALGRIRELDNHYKNDEGKKVSFKAIVSVPCFEFWLLLHFFDAQAFYRRQDVFAKLKSYMPRYAKALANVYELTRNNIATATERAKSLQARYQPDSGTDPFTNVNELANLMISLRSNEVSD